MAKTRANSEGEEPVPIMHEEAPAKKMDKEDSGLVGKFADWTTDAPILGSLGGFSLTLAVRWLLWLCVVLVCLGGLVAGLLGAGATYLAVGSLSQSVGGPLDSATGMMTDAALSLAQGALAGGNVTMTTSNMSNSFRNLSAGLKGTAQTLRGLTGLPVIGNSLGGLDTAVGQIETSAGGLDDAATSLDATGSVSSDAALKMGNVASDLKTLSASLSESKRTVQSALGMLQIGVLAFGLALEMMLAGTLMLALAYGPPKK